MNLEVYPIHWPLLVIDFLFKEPNYIKYDILTKLYLSWTMNRRVILLESQEDKWIIFPLFKFPLCTYVISIVLR